MQWPAEVIAIVEKATERHSADIDAAVKDAETKIRRLDIFPEIESMLISAAVRELIHHRRHNANTQTKRDAGQYDTQRSFEIGSATTEAYRSVYDYYIAGIQLGSVLGSQLTDIAASEQAKADGHTFNAELCAALKRLVPNDKAVRDCVSEKKLRAMFKKLQKTK
jgi:hypothetical protein